MPTRALPVARVSSAACALIMTCPPHHTHTHTRAPHTQYYCERPRLTLGVQLVLPGPHVIQLLAMDAASTAPAADRNTVDYLEAMENTGSYVTIDPDL